MFRVYFRIIELEELHAYHWIKGICKCPQLYIKIGPYDQTIKLHQSYKVLSLSLL